MMMKMKMVRMSERLSGLDVSLNPADLAGEEKEETDRKVEFAGPDVGKFGQNNH